MLSHRFIHSSVYQALRASFVGQFRGKIFRVIKSLWCYRCIPRKKARKPTIKPDLPLRFPGAQDTLEIGGRGQYANLRSNHLHDPIPPPPEFSEDLNSLQDRVTKMVGKVAYPSTTARTHPIIKKLLDQDEERRKDFVEKGYSWRKPFFDSAIEKRRLRILNAIFLATQSLGCRPSMSASQYDREKLDTSVQVGDQHIYFTLETMASTGRKGIKAKDRKGRLRLSVDGKQHTSFEQYCWEDTSESGIETSRKDIVIGIIMAGEIQYRGAAKWHHNWLVQRKAELEEQERKRIEEEKRKARELREKRERERIEALLADATALQHAEIIREYVKTIRSKTSEISAPDEDIEKWALWALAQADKIDPLKNLHFLKMMREE